ncbi:glutaredoxin 3 [Candidatus Aquarickettsia rohweri]|uniref:Glutaredoxin n=2 Tax=Candidatus Aquarickettsia rohweri TaxID=2602574 RepID=A0A429XEV1_9RICK|nr:glutaredoxin 3 [Candidatus Aquarickettsia rohweri]
MIMITIYTKNNCPYCIRAKDLLNKRKLEYKEINISENPELLEEMLEKSQGMKTMPQIFIDEKHIGGCDDLYKYDEDVGFDMK